MIKKQKEFFKRSMILIDTLLICVVLMFSYLIYPKVVINGYRRLFLLNPLDSYFFLFFSLIPLLWVSMLNYYGIYNSFVIKKMKTIFHLIFKTAVYIFVIYVILAFTIKMYYFNILYVFYSIFLTALVLLTEKIILYHILRHISKKGYNMKNILIVGTGERAKKFIRLIQKHSEWGLHIVGLIDDEEKKVGKEILGHKIIGTLSQIPVLLEKKAVNEVAFIVPRTWLSKVEESLLACETQGIKTTLAADIFNLKFAKPVFTDFDGFPTIQYETTVEDMLQLCIKRVIDIALSITLLTLLFPLMLAIILIIKLESRGRIFFNQIRTGLNAKKFNMYKFRTMVKNAENMRSSLLVENEMDGPVFKIKDDPRLTRIGKVLRRTSLDELPQLFNILKGEMSFVGPRPLPAYEAKSCQPWEKRRTSMKPGLTCTWQVSGRNNISFKEWIAMDLAYIDNWSLLLDMKLMLKTLPAVFRGHGAC